MHTHAHTHIHRRRGWLPPFRRTTATKTKRDVFVAVLTQMHALLLDKQEPHFSQLNEFSILSFCRWCMVAPQTVFSNCKKKKKESPTADCQGEHTEKYMNVSFFFCFYSRNKAPVSTFGWKWCCLMSDSVTTHLVEFSNAALTLRRLRGAIVQAGWLGLFVPAVSVCIYSWDAELKKGAPLSLPPRLLNIQNRWLKIARFLFRDEWTGTRAEKCEL